MVWFDLLSSATSGRRVVIGHANGVISVDLAESTDAHRESVRVWLDEGYRTMLGHSGTRSGTTTGRC